MRQMKRITSLFLSIIMVLSIAVCGITTVSAEGIEPDTSWYDNAAEGTTTFEISNVNEFLGLWKKTLSSYTNLTTYSESDVTARNATSGKTFVLTADIDLSGINFPGFMDFSGSFDGQGHKITGFTQDLNKTSTTNRGKNGGLFRNITSGGYVKNLILEDASVTLSAGGQDVSVGALIGNITKGDLTVENVHVDADVTLTVAETGGSSNVPRRAGGVIGLFSAGSGTLTVNNVVFEGSVTATSTGLFAKAAAILAGNHKGTYDQANSAVVNISNALANAALSIPEGDSNLKDTWCADSTSTAVNKGINVTNSIDATGVTLDEAYLAANPTLLKTWTTCRYTENEATVKTILPVGFAQMLEKTESSAFAAFKYSKAWIQESTTSYTVNNQTRYKLRILGTVETTNWDSMSFKVTIKVGEGEAQAVSGIEAQTIVYTSVQAAGDTVTAAELGGEYIYAVVLKGIPKDQTFTVTVTPVRTVGGVDYNCAPYETTITAGA